MAMSLALKRPAEELLEAPSCVTDEDDSSIQCSPVKLLNTHLGMAAPAKKRKEDVSFFQELAANVGADMSASRSEGDVRDQKMQALDQLSNNNKVVDSYEKDISPPHHISAINGHRSFPCVWLGGASPTRIPEEGDRSPNPVPTSLQSEGAETPLAPPSSSLYDDSPHRLSTASSSLSPHTPPALLQLPFQEAKTSSPLKENGFLPPFASKQLSHINGQAGGRQNTSPSAINGILSSGNTELPMGMTNPPPLQENGEAMEVCPECHKVFKRKVYLQRHMEREHWSTAKVFKCEDCNYETKHQSNLSVHRRTHTGERPYHCGACGQRYTQGHLLKSHIRSRHGGNMEFYNLEKKSESTRGRKSLDMKHESLYPPHCGKQDKISALLQAANNASPPGQLPMPKFGSLLSPSMSQNQFMGSLSPYFNTLRPMISPLSLASGLLGGPRFLTLGGLPNGFPQHCLPSMALPLMGSNVIQSSPIITEIKSERSPSKHDDHNIGIKIPLKVPDIIHPQKHSPQLADESPLPQDLTMGKRSRNESMNGGALHMSRSPLGSSCEPEDLSLRYSMGEMLHMGQMANSPHLSARTPSMLPPPPSVHSDLSTPSPITQEEESDSNMDSNDSATEATTALPDEIPAKSVHFVKPHDVHPPTDLMLKDGLCCTGPDCTHLRKLKDLRKNIFRVLSTFTPDLALENGIDYETDEVDEILYDVIYCNLEEECASKTD